VKNVGDLALLSGKRITIKKKWYSVLEIPESEES